MPKIIRSDDPTYTDQLTVPRDGEAIDAGDVNAPFLDLLGNDRVLYGLIADLSRRLEQMQRGQGGFTISLPATLRLEPNRTYTLPGAVGIGRLQGYDQTIDLSAIDLPAGVTATFSPDLVPGAGTKSDLVLNTAVDLVPGPYDVTVRGTGADGRLGEGRMRLEVSQQTQQASFTVAVPANLGVDRATGATAVTATVDVERLGMFNTPISLSVPNLPVGMTAAWSANPVTGSDAVQKKASVLTLTAGESLPAGVYSLTLRAEGGGVVRTQAIRVTVTAPAAAPTEADYALRLEYDAGDPSTMNGATVYIERRGGFTGPVELSVMDDGYITVHRLTPGPVVLINGQPWRATVSGNTARLTADGTSRGWANSGVAGPPNWTPGAPILAGGYSGPVTHSGVLGRATIGGRVVERSVQMVYRHGTRMY